MPSRAPRRRLTLFRKSGYLLRATAYSEHPDRLVRGSDLHVSNAKWSPLKHQTERPGPQLTGILQACVSPRHSKLTCDFRKFGCAAVASNSLNTGVRPFRAYSWQPYLVFRSDPDAKGWIYSGGLAVPQKTTISGLERPCWIRFL